MDDTLKSRITEDLRKSGFQSEMVALETFLRSDWQCEGSFTYVDRESKASREIDLEATLSLARRRESGGSVQCTMRLLAEVKKAEEPWVVLRERRENPTSAAVDAWDNMTYALNLPTAQVLLAEALSKNSLLSVQGWRGRGVHESFKKPSFPSRWYAAGVSVCKAAESALEAEVATLDPLRRSFGDSILFVLIKPLIVLDGMLVSAHLDEDGGMVVDAIDAAAFRFQYRTSEYTRHGYSLDVVTLSALAKYLELSAERVRSS